MSRTGVIVSELNTQIFLNFFRDHQWPEPEPVTLRLYHDEKGSPLCYSCDPMAGNWIPVTAEQYARASFRVRVVDGKLIELGSDLRPKLKPSEHGTVCADTDVTVIVTDRQPHLRWSLS